MHDFFGKTKKAISNVWHGTDENPAGFKATAVGTIPTAVTATALTTYWTPFLPLAGDDGDNPAAKFFFIVAWLAVYAVLSGALFYNVDQSRNMRAEYRIRGEIKRDEEAGAGEGLLHNEDPHAEGRPLNRGGPSATYGN